MGRIQVVLNDDVEKEFRQKIGKEGFKKGNLSKIVEKLIKNYLRKKGKKR